MNRRKQSRVRFDASRQTLHPPSPAPSPETPKPPRFSGDVFAHASAPKGAATTGRAYRGPRKACQTSSRRSARPAMHSARSCTRTARRGMR